MKNATQSVYHIPNFLLLISFLLLLIFNNCNTGKEKTTETSNDIQATKDSLENPITKKDVITQAKDSPLIPKVDSTIKKTVEEKKPAVVVNNADQKAPARVITTTPVKTEPVEIKSNPQPVKINNEPSVKDEPGKEVKVTLPTEEVKEIPTKPAEDKHKIVSPTQEKWIVPDSYKNKANPVPSDGESLANGKTLFLQHCASCHGKGGAGDGTKAAQLKTTLSSFKLSAFQSQSDGSLFYKIREGRDDMPSYKKKIPDADDIWSVVNYLRTLK
jgi:mono/diheme cytochrome c family protein